MRKRKKRRMEKEKRLLIHVWIRDQVNVIHSQEVRSFMSARLARSPIMISSPVFGLDGKQGDLVQSITYDLISHRSL